jgi:hypothetical protein
VATTLSAARVLPEPLAPAAGVFSLLQAARANNEAARRAGRDSEGSGFIGRGAFCLGERKSASQSNA